MGFWQPQEQLPKQKGFIFLGWKGESCPPPKFVFPAKTLAGPLSFSPSLGRMASSCLLPGLGKFLGALQVLASLKPEWPLQNPGPLPPPKPGLPQAPFPSMLPHPHFPSKPPVTVITERAISTWEGLKTKSIFSHWSPSISICPLTMGVSAPNSRVSLGSTNSATEAQRSESLVLITDKRPSWVEARGGLRSSTPRLSTSLSTQVGKLRPGRGGG